jgi:hypothetical protein
MCHCYTTQAASQCSISASYTVAGVQSALNKLVLHAATQQESTYMTPAACLADMKTVLERNRRAAQVCITTPIQCHNSMRCG